MVPLVSSFWNVTGNEVFFFSFSSTKVPHSSLSSVGVATAVDPFWQFLCWDNSTITQELCQQLSLGVDGGGGKGAMRWEPSLKVKRDPLPLNED